MNRLERLLFALFVLPILGFIAWAALVFGCVINLFTGHKQDG